VNSNLLRPKTINNHHLATHLAIKKAVPQTSCPGAVDQFLGPPTQMLSLRMPARQVTDNERRQTVEDKVNLLPSSASLDDKLILSFIMNGRRFHRQAKML
jgi:hypothetical protein